METMPGHHFSKNPEISPAMSGSGKENRAYLFQALAHLYFISSGLWLWCRWRLRSFFYHAATDPFKEREALTHRFQVYLHLLQRWGIIETEFVGFEEVDSWRGCVIAPNHPSILDAILLMICIPSLDCVINVRLFSSPITSGAANLCDFIRNDSLLSMTKACKKRLSSGSNILIFPEGTRTKTQPVNPFHHIYALVSTCSGAPIRTILIESDSDYFGCDFSYFKPAKCPMRFRLTAGRVFQTDAVTDPRQLSSEIEGYFRQNLANEESRESPPTP